MWMSSCTSVVLGSLSISDQMLPQIVITVVRFGKLSLILVTFVQSFIEKLLLGSEQIALFNL